MTDLTPKQNRRNFTITNNLLDLIGKTLSEKEVIILLNGIGIKSIMCIDSEDKDLFFNLTGLMIDGKHNIDTNKMEFEIFEL